MDLDIDKEMNVTPTTTDYATIFRVHEQRATSLSPVQTHEERAIEAEQLEQRKKANHTIAVKRQRMAKRALESPYRTNFPFSSITTKSDG